jgi:cysteine desulfurase
VAIKKPVYLDHHATTPIDPLVLEVLERAQRDYFGNPASASHSFGWGAQALVEKARQQVAELIGADDREIVFTSGATEANNLALLGTAAAANEFQKKIITTTLEHSSVSEPVHHLEKQGWCVHRIESDETGIINAMAVHESLDKETLLVSVIAAQNEIGTLQPLKNIGQICRDKGVLFHSDAAQAAAHLPLDVEALGVDLLSLSAHKMYGPKGVGALWVRRCHPPLPLNACFHGGDQEGGLRPGTLNVPGIAAFGEACRLALLNREEEVKRISRLRQRFLNHLSEKLSGVHLNGAMEPRLPGNLNLWFEGIREGQLLPRLTVLALSSGSACRSSDPTASPVLMSLGLDSLQAASSLRIGLGRFSTSDEVDFATEKIAAVVQKLRLENHWMEKFLDGR